MDGNEDRVYRCANGHVRFGHDLDGETNEVAQCRACDSVELTEVTDPLELMALAEAECHPRYDQEEAHKFSDAAILARLKQYDPVFAERYERIRERGFWYA